MKNKLPSPLIFLLLRGTKFNEDNPWKFRETLNRGSGRTQKFLGVLRPCPGNSPRGVIGRAGRVIEKQGLLPGFCIFGNEKGIGPEFIKKTRCPILYRAGAGQGFRKEASISLWA